jgi:hypothetical protein
MVFDLFALIEVNPAVLWSRTLIVNRWLRNTSSVCGKHVPVLFVYYMTNQHILTRVEWRMTIVEQGFPTHSEHMSLFVCLMVFSATFNHISVISWRSVLLVEETGGLGENHRTAVSHWHMSTFLVLLKVRVIHFFPITCLRVFVYFRFHNVEVKRCSVPNGV